MLGSISFHRGCINKKLGRKTLDITKGGKREREGHKKQTLKYIVISHYRKHGNAHSNSRENKWRISIATKTGIQMYIQSDIYRAKEKKNFVRVLCMRKNDRNQIRKYVKCWNVLAAGELECGGT